MVSRFDWLVSLSVANLLFWRDWVNLFPNVDDGGTEALYLGLRQSPSAYLAIPAFVVALSVILRVLLGWLRRQPAPNAIARAAKFLGVGFALLSPFVLFTFGRAVYYAGRPSLVTMAPTSSRNPALRRTVVLLFDEMDEGIFFNERDPGISLPHIDRFRKESFVGARAFTPNGCTLLAVPSLLTGEAVVDATAASEAELSLQLAGTEKPLSAMPQLFSDAKAAGARIALLGYFHPYCRLFGQWTDHCLSFSSLEYDYGPFPFLPLTLLSPWTTREALTHARNFERLSPSALALVADPSFDLVYLHIPIPRPPGITDEGRGYGEAAYLANGERADRFFGELRLRLEQSGLWKRTNILLTSDHGYRDSARALEKAEGRSRYLHVPFVVKFAGDGVPASHPTPFSTRGLRSWVGGLLKGEIANQADLVERLSRSQIPASDPAPSSNEYCKLPNRTD